MFVAYVGSIEDQFEFVTRRWANSAVQPNVGGHDPIIGQRDERRQPPGRSTLPRRRRAAPDRAPGGLRRPDRRRLLLRATDQRRRRPPRRNHDSRPRIPVEWGSGHALVLPRHRSTRLRAGTGPAPVVARRPADRPRARGDGHARPTGSRCFFAFFSRFSASSPSVSRPSSPRMKSRVASSPTEMRSEASSRARYSVSARIEAARARSSSACTRSRSACRFCASRISGAA